MGTGDVLPATMVYTDPDEVPWSAYLALTGVAVVIVAALLPWYDELGTAVTGLEHSDGYLTVGVGVATVGFLIGFEWNLVARIAAAISGVLAIVVGYNLWRQVSDQAIRETAPGLDLTVLGGGLLVIAAIWGSREARRRAAEAETAGDSGDDPAAATEERA